MLTGRAIATLIIFILSITCVIAPFSLRLPFVRRRARIHINLTTAPLLAVVVLWASGCIDAKVVRNGIVGDAGIKPYNILILFFSLAYMAVTLDLTGILQAAAFWVSNHGGESGWRLFIYFYLMLTGLSIVLGNDPVILSGTAFLVYYTRVAEVSHVSWLFSEFAAANTASMVLFVGNPTNVVLCEGFSIKNIAFTAYTILPFVSCSVFCFIALALQFRKEKYIPRRLHVARLDPRTVLHDPIGAWVGSILMGVCLALIMCISFVGVDVWEVTLPFAVCKFIFDLSWDYWRFKHGKLPARPDQNLPDTNAIKMDKLEPISTKPPPTPASEDPSSAIQLIPTTLAPSQSQAASTRQPKSPEPVPRKFPKSTLHYLHERFPTLVTAFPRLPFALIPFAFCQFILVEALAHQGWIDIFANWLNKASHGKLYSTIWLVGTLGIILCNLSGTNIGATILLTKVLQAAHLPSHTLRAGAIALAIASNIGAVSFTFSASLAGLLWQAILKQKGIKVKQRTFALWNILPIIAMAIAGLGCVCAEMAVIYHGVEA